MTPNDSLLATVQEILFREWDPIGINDNELCRDEYDSYAPVICRWLQAGIDESQLAAHLSQIQTESMGMSVTDNALHHRIARRLIALVAQ